MAKDTAFIPGSSGARLCLCLDTGSGRCQQHQAKPFGSCEPLPGPLHPPGAAWLGGDAELSLRHQCPGHHNSSWRGEEAAQVELIATAVHSDHSAPTGGSRWMSRPRGEALASKAVVLEDGTLGVIGL